MEQRKDRYRRYPGEPGYRERPAQKNGHEAVSGVPPSDYTPQETGKAPACAFPSLGPQVWGWIAGHLLVPDGPLAGQPLELNGDQSDVLYRWYAVDEAGFFVFRRGAWRAAQGTGKSPLLGAISLAELAGPTRCDGFDANGAPVGRPPVTPWVQVAASSEDQSANTYRAAYLMAAESDLADTVLDVGRTRINLVDGAGLLEPVTASAGSRLGQRLTFAVLDETHQWTRRNGGHKLAEVLRRNAAKTQGRTFESTNAHLVGEDSVAERTHKASLGAAEGLLYVATEGPPVEDLTDFETVRAALTVPYGDAAVDRGGWVDLDRIARDVGDPDTDPDDALRFFFNRLTSGGFAVVDIQVWESMKTHREVEAGERIALGFDGSINDDMTCLWGCTADGFLFSLGVWSRPEGAGSAWRVPRDEVHARLAEVFDRYSVGKMLADPPKWQDELADWVDLYGGPDSDVVEALDTNSARRFAPLCDRFATAVIERNLSHDGDPVLTQALAACARKPVRLVDDPDDGRSRFVVVKADTRKIDAAVAAILAYGAAKTMPEPEYVQEPSVSFI